MAEMRALIFELRPAALAEEGLVAALRKQGAALSAREQMAVTVQGPEERLELEAAVEEHLYRIASEALHNVVKHGGADRAAVTVIAEAGSLRVVVRDDGAGFDPDAGYPGHLGLSTMAERAETIGAELADLQRPGNGTHGSGIPVPRPPRSGGRRPRMPAEREVAGPIRVLLVDDHRVVRSGVRPISSRLRISRWSVRLATAARPWTASPRLEAGRQGLPDVVLMDLLMPGLDGISATSQIRSRWPAIEVVVMTSFAEEAKVRGALEAGAAGYLLKDAGADEVAQAIRAALAGRMHLDPAVARLLADSLRAPRRPARQT